MITIGTKRITKAHEAKWLKLKTAKSSRRYEVWVKDYSHYECTMLSRHCDFDFAYNLAFGRAKFNAELIANDYGGDVFIEKTPFDQLPRWTVFHRGREIFSYYITRE